MHMNFSKDCQIVRVEASAVAGQTEIVSDVVDTRGFESVCFIAALGDVTDLAELTMTVKTNSADSVSSPAPVTTEASATFTAGASDADGKMMVVDVHMPRQRYAFVSLTRETANAVVDGIFAILYNGNARPYPAHSSVVASNFSNDPDSV